MSTTTIAPHTPRATSCPRLIVPNVIVSVARGGAGIPASRGIDAGRHVERDDRRAACAQSVQLFDGQRDVAAQRGSPRDPVPSSASTTIDSPPVSSAATSLVIGTPAASAASRSAPASTVRAAMHSTTRTATPTACSACATTQPSPPLLPGPVAITTPRRSPPPCANDLRRRGRAGALHEGARGDPARDRGGVARGGSGCVDDRDEWMDDGGVMTPPVRCR